MITYFAFFFFFKKKKAALLFLVSPDWFKSQSMSRATSVCISLNTTGQNKITVLSIQSVLPKLLHKSRSGYSFVFNMSFAHRQQWIPFPTRSLLGFKQETSKSRYTSVLKV